MEVTIFFGFDNVLPGINWFEEMLALKTISVLLFLFLDYAQAGIHSQVNNERNQSFSPVHIVFGPRIPPKNQDFTFNSRNAAYL
jgi:hypothetical protein